MDVPLSAVIAIVGMLVAIVGSLIVVNLHSIKACITKLSDRLDKQDDLISSINLRQSASTIDSEREFVRGETFLRETGFLRRSLEQLTASLNRIEGNLKVVELLPDICGDIARKIVHEFKNGEKPI